MKQTTKQEIYKIRWDEVENKVTILSILIAIAQAHAKPDNRYTGIYGVPRGGLIPAVMLCHLLKLPLVTHAFEDRTLIVDDIVDSGKTLAAPAFRNLDKAVLIDKRVMWPDGDAMPTLFNGDLPPKFYAGATVKGNPQYQKWVQFPWETNVSTWRNDG